MRLARLLIVLSFVVGCGTVTLPTPTATPVTLPPTTNPAPPATTRPRASSSALLVQSGWLEIQNRGAPDFKVEIDGATVANIPCGSSVRVTPGEDSVPLLPWDLTLTRVADGSQLFKATIDRLPLYYVQFADSGTGLSDQVILGPAAPCPTSLPSPSTELVQAHDRFWDPFVDFGPPIGLPYGLVSVRDATELADIVVRGSIADLYIGEKWPGTPGQRATPLAYLAVEVEEVLKGKPESRSRGEVEVQFGWGFFRKDFDRVASAPPPEGEYLWFLIDESKHRERQGQPARPTEIAPFAYFIPNEVQSVVLNANGVAEVVLAERFEGVWGTERFPMTIRGQAFEDVLDEVRDVATSR